MVKNIKMMQIKHRKLFIYIDLLYLFPFVDDLLLNFVLFGVLLFKLKSKINSSSEDAKPTCLFAFLLNGLSKIE